MSVPMKALFAEWLDLINTTRTGRESVTAC